MVLFPTNAVHKKNGGVDMKKDLDESCNKASTLFKKLFLGTDISSVDIPGHQEYAACQCCFDSGNPQGDCCPLY